MKQHATHLWPLFLLVALSLLACIVALMAPGGRVDLVTALRYFVWNLPVCLLIGLVDYRVVAWSHHRGLPSGIWSIVLDLFMSNVLLSLISIVYIYAEAYLRGTEVHLLQRIILSVFCNSAIILMVEVFYYNRQYLENKARLATIEKEKAQYQLEALKNQINPHFLFNSLNVLSSLAFRDAAKANLFAKELSSVYRYLLTTYELMTVPLRDELDFVKSYVYLEQIRFGETLHICLTTDESALSKRIVPAALQMLVENALKHNINTCESPLVIDIRVERERVVVTNDLQLRSSVSKNRMGLANLEKQYSIHGKHIEVQKSASAFTVVLPLL